MTTTETPRIPEIVEPDELLPADLVALRRFAWMLDAAVAIPGTRRRIGVSAAVGLVPGVGDAVGAFLSAWIILGGLRHRVPIRKIARMIVNVVVDVLIGSIPVIGDLADILFKENLGNVDLLIRHRDRRRPPRRASELILGTFLLLAIFSMLGLVAIVIAILVVAWLLRNVPVF
ncbi:MAG TPA: DUF4112 domain-containing protein [Thermoanaerobaculia bacterium]|nr:DUF4112 domain-containing protein [Thermoanaerobaculia bacterium]